MLRWVRSGSSSSTPAGTLDGPVSTVAEPSAPAGLRLYATGAHAFTSHALPASGALTIGRGAASELAGAELVIDAISRGVRDIDVLGSYGPDDHEVLLVETEPEAARAL